jgi:hypothetical protein
MEVANQKRRSQFLHQSECETRLLQALVAKLTKYGPLMMAISSCHLSSLPGYTDIPVRSCHESCLSPVANAATIRLIDFLTAKRQSSGTVMGMLCRYSRTRRVMRKALSLVAKAAILGLLLYFALDLVNIETVGESRL